MDWLHIFRPEQAARRIEDLALEVAERCRAAVRARIGQYSASMSRSEARGYVRARATGAVCCETDILMSRRNNLPSGMRAELIRQSTDHVIALVTHDLAAATVPRAVARKAG